MILVDNEVLTRTLKKLRHYSDIYKDLSHEEMHTKCIDERLAKTLAVYNEHIDEVTRDVVSKASIRVMKTISKMQKFEDKEIIQSNFMTEEEKKHNGNPFI